MVAMIERNFENQDLLSFRVMCVAGSNYDSYVATRVVYQFGIFGRYSVGISPVLPIPYRRKTRSVHFGIKKGAVAPFFLKRGAMAPFLRSSNPLLEKKGEERGEVYEKGGNDNDRIIPIRTGCI